MLDYFIFNGKDSRDFGMMVKSLTSYDAPERDYTEIEIPGRDGNLIIDNGRDRNNNIGYNIRIFSPEIGTEAENGNADLDFALQQIKNWLATDGRYYKLIDSTNPDYYKLACRKGGINFIYKGKNVVDAEVKFTVKPYKYRLDGDRIIKIESSSQKTIYNPENFPSLPIVRLYGMGTLTVVINGSTYTVNHVNTYVIIDSESQNVYSRVGTANMNSNAQFRNFPKLIVGNNYIEKLSGTTKVEIEPRWRTK